MSRASVPLDNPLWPRCFYRWRRRGILGLLMLAVLVPTHLTPALAQDDFPVLARVGPWPTASNTIGYAGRLWFVNSVTGRNHNSADIYSYDPRTGRVRYERHMFSQDSGTPLVAGGLLYWPFEDSRFSLGWGNFLVTDGQDWRLGTIPTAGIYHTHAMVRQGRRIVAATSAWRAGLQVSQDGGRTWRKIYDHPTPERRVSRIVDLVAAGAFVFGNLHNAGRRRLLRLDGDAVAEAPGWPKDRPILGLAAFRGRLHGLVREAGGVALWRSDGRHSERIAGPWRGWRPFALAAGAGQLWAVGTGDSGAAVRHSRDGSAWRPYRRLPGGTPEEIAVYAGEVYVAGTGDDGKGILWGPPPPASAGPSRDLADVHDLGPRSPVELDWDAAAARLDRLLSEPAAYADHGGRVRDLAYADALARPPTDFFTDRLAQALADESVSLIGGKVRMPAAKLARWILLWATAVAGEGRVPPDILLDPWTAPKNTAEKYFDAPPIALWTAAAIGQRDRATITAMVARLDFPDDPLWLRGDVVGALTVLTGERFGYDTVAWRRWWKEVAAGWPE